MSEYLANFEDTEWNDDWLESWNENDIEYELDTDYEELLDG